MVIFGCVLNLFDFSWLLFFILFPSFGHSHTSHWPCLAERECWQMKKLRSHLSRFRGPRGLHKGACGFRLRLKVTITPKDHMICRWRRKLYCTIFSKGNVVIMWNQFNWCRLFTKNENWTMNSPMVFLTSIPFFWGVQKTFKKMYWSFVDTIHIVLLTALWAKMAGTFFKKIF